MPNILIQPASGAIYFDNAAPGSSTPSFASSFVYLSGSDGTLFVVESSSKVNSEVFRIMGNSGNLFSIIDSLTGQLFSVNKIGGLPVLEVFDSDTVRAGTYLSNTFVVSGTQVSLGGIPVTINSIPQKLTVYGNSTFTGTLSTVLGTSNNWNSCYSTVNSISAFRIDNTISSNYTFSDLDNTKTYHVDTTSGILSGIFPNSISNNFSVNLILVSTNAFVVSSSQTPILNSNGNKVNLPFSSVLIYKYNNVLYGLGNFY